MLITNDYILPVEITGYVRAALADYNFNQFTLSQWLPNTTIADIDYRVDRGGAGLADIASYRTYDAESPLGRRDSLSRIMGELPPISRKLRNSEYDRLRAGRAANPQVRDAILNDGVKLARDIGARVEKARADALVTGTVPFTEFGTGFTVDFGRRASHSVTASVAHTAGSADIVGDLENWQNTYLQTNGVLPGCLLVSRPYLAIMMRNQTIRNMVYPNTSSQPSVVGMTAVSEALVAFGLPPVMEYRSMVNVSGTATNLIPQNVALFLPAPVDPTDTNGTQLGGTWWGMTAESMEPEYGLPVGDQQGIVAGAYKTQDPVAVWTKAAAISMPVLANPDLSFAATVY